MVAVFLACLMASPSWAGYKMEFGEHVNAEIGLWGQAWFQYVENGKGHDGLKDFMLRRGYFYLKGEVTQYLGFFTHIASDKIGQEGLDSSGLGLGSGVAWRDAWASVNCHDWARIQLGRMYVPITRAYGTTSTKTMMTLDLPFLQGGSRGKIFYAQKVGRDDSVVLWGNPLDGLLQYRLMVGEGVEGDCDPVDPTDTCNPDDHVRVAGRLSVSLLDPEKGWFNKGTYLGKKKVLSFGAGFDRQGGLTLDGDPDQRNLVWTVDAFFDHPVGDGAITFEAAFIDIYNCTQEQPQAYTDLAEGDDARNWYLNGGFLVNNVGPGGLQPYFRYEGLHVEGKKKTHFASGGLNYYFKGHNAKVTADYMHVHTNNDSKDNTSIFTLQIAFGF
jgi:hypothetical protein